jgi:hypothetical protein
MNNAELKQLEQNLGLKLPEAYRKIVREFPEELRDWPPVECETPSRDGDDFLLDVGEIVKAQKAARKRLGEKLPPHSFVIGRSGENFWFVDASVSDPPVRLIIEGMDVSGWPSMAALLERVRAKHGEAWAKLWERTVEGANAVMSPEALIAEARKLARPAVLLVDKGKEYAAVWKGTGAAPPPKGKWEHHVSIDASFLPDNPRRLRGVISVYLCVEDSDRFHQVAVVHAAKARLPAKPDGRRLFAKRIDCLPPMEALLKFGAEPIQNWVRANSVDPDHGYDPASFSAPNQDALKSYGKVINAEHPFLARGGYAMLGGWSWCFMWCYGIDEGYPWSLLEKALVVLTVGDDEPWIEVFDDGKGFVTFSRIT